MFVNQKVQEISYALIRVAAYIRRQDLRQRIERMAFQLLEDVAGQSFESALRTSASLELLINLGKNIYEIEPVNAKIITGEVETLNAAMRQLVGLGEMPNFGEMFSKPPAVISSDSWSGNDSATANVGQANSSQTRQDNAAETGNGNNGINGTIRQSAILEKIRQTDNRQTQLKDLLAAFPEVSERTMRYDLQRLCNQGILERIGSGGPGSYYALKA